MALSGEAADEVFGCYPEFHELAHVQADTFPWLASKSYQNTVRRYLDSGLLKKLDLRGYVEEQYRRARAEVPTLTGPTSADACERRMREVCYLYLTRHLPELLDRKDRMSMALVWRCASPTAITVWLSMSWRPMGSQDVRRRENSAARRDRRPAAAVGHTARQERLSGYPGSELRPNAAHPVHCAAE